MKLSKFSIVLCVLCCLNGRGARALTLGRFQFDDAQFGDALLESDGGEFESTHWLNTVNEDPGNPGALTGPNVETGIGNIGLNGVSPIYTIQYDTPITNGPGDDLGIISARFSRDIFNLAVSTDGINFTPFVAFGPELGVNTKVNKVYYYGGTGPFGCVLYVTPVDLSVFGLASDETVSAVEVTSFQEGDLIRVAGFEESEGLELVSAFSRKTDRHNSFDVPLPGIEDRSDGKRFVIGLTFNNNVTGADSAATSCGTIGSVSVDPDDTHTLLVTFDGQTCNQQNVTITAINVHDDQGNTLDSAETSGCFLIGDVDGDGRVGNGDIGNIQGHLGEITDSTNFRDDINADGHINNQDVQAARAHRRQSCE